MIKINLADLLFYLSLRLFLKILGIVYLILTGYMIAKHSPILNTTIVCLIGIVSLAVKPKYIPERSEK